jgi:molybdate-binding protein
LPQFDDALVLFLFSEQSAQVIVADRFGSIEGFCNNLLLRWRDRNIGNRNRGPGTRGKLEANIFDRIDNRRGSILS